MLRLSSNLTLFMKIVLPISWMSFFGLFGLVIFLLDPMDEPFLTSTYFRIGYVIWFLVFAVLVFFTLFQLKRVETEGNEMFVTDYFKTVKFPIENIKKISVVNLGIVKLARIHLNIPGRFGKKIPFLTKWVNVESFIQKNPSLDINF